MVNESVSNIIHRSNNVANVIISKLLKDKNEKGLFDITLDRDGGQVIPP